MGIVYEARQVSLNRKVALKVLAGSLGLTSKAVVRFRREAEAAAKLHHTNIVPIAVVDTVIGRHGRSSIWCEWRAVIVSGLEGPDAAAVTYERWFREDKIRTALPHRSLPYRVYCLLGRRQDAIQLSQEYHAELGPSLVQGDFLVAVDEYVCGRLSDEGLLDAAVRHGERISAHSLIGLTRLAEGDRAGAMEHFGRIDRAGNWLFSNGARNPFLSWGPLFLERMRKDPTWPPWIPVKQGEAATQPESEPTGDTDGE
jgi:hypothetical protein